MLLKPKTSKVLWFIVVTLLSVLVTAACSSSVAIETPKSSDTAKLTETSVAETPAVAAATEVQAPFLKEWQASGHNNVAGEQFRHWDAATPAEVPVTCAGCHTSAGFLERAKTGKVTTPVAAKDAQGVTCDTCHNTASMALTSVTFPSGAVISGLGGEARCMTCHQGRQSKVSVDKQIADFKATDPDAVVAPINKDGKDVAFGFLNVHYFAAAATLYGNEVHGGYEYDGKSYDAKNDHTADMNTCIGCHDQHTLEVKVDKCATCHDNVSVVEDLKKIRQPSSLRDYDGDGNITEGMGEEIAGLQEILYAEIQKYAKNKVGVEIKYDSETNPYFLGLDSKAYPKWTPRLLKAAYNYQVSIKDPGAFAHGNKYIVQLLYDSIEDIGGDVTKLARDDAGHFAGNAMAFRDWDEPNRTVPFGCVKCHTATGLPTFIKNGGSTVVTATGTTVTTGVGAMPVSNGFQCSTCHNTEKFPENYSVASVTFPSGKSVSLGGKDADGKFVADKSNLCISCHMGRESTVSVNNAMMGKGVDVVDPKAPINFKNVHYFAAGATLFGNDVMGAYQYKNQKYVGLTAHPVNKCIDCHDKHSLEVKTDTCKTCHTGATDPENIRYKDDVTDYDGDGNITEGIKGEIDTLAQALYAEIQSYAEKKGTPLVYDASSYPYFFLDKDKDGKADKDDKGASIGYTAFSPRLLEAAFNYQYVQKDPGAFTHNPKYVIQFLYDSIKDLGGNVSKFKRP